MKSRREVINVNGRNVLIVERPKSRKTREEEALTFEFREVGAKSEDVVVEHA